MARTLGETGITQIIRMTSGGGDFLIEVDFNEASGVEETQTLELLGEQEKGRRISGYVARPVRIVSEAMAEVLTGAIVENCKVLAQALREVQKEDDNVVNASAEFSLKFTTEGNVYLAKASGEGTVKVCVSWVLGKAE